MPSDPPRGKSADEYDHDESDAISRQNRGQQKLDDEHRDPTRKAQGPCESADPGWRPEWPSREPFDRHAESHNS
jgi:hypothetical protein